MSASAHVGGIPGGCASGLFHRILGWDHVAAMVAALPQTFSASSSFTRAMVKAARGMVFAPVSVIISCEGGLRLHHHAKNILRRNRETVTARLDGNGDPVPGLLCLP